MTTLSEFKEIEAKQTVSHKIGSKDCESCNATKTIQIIAPKALPALIAVAEGMAIDMGRIANHFDQDVYENGWKSLALEMADVARQALAAYEAWKGKIEEE